MANILVVVDMQNDFIDGALGTAEAVKIVPYVKQVIANFDGKVCFTRDTHFANYMDTQEGKNLPVRHCIQGTPGWELLEMAGRKRGYLISGGEVHSERMAKVLIDEFRSGKLGKFTLEMPEDLQ